MGNGLPLGSYQLILRMCRLTIRGLCEDSQTQPAMQQGSDLFP